MNTLKRIRSRAESESTCFRVRERTRERANQRYHTADNSRLIYSSYRHVGYMKIFLLHLRQLYSPMTRHRLFNAQCMPQKEIIIGGIKRRKSEEQRERERLVDSWNSSRNNCSRTLDGILFNAVSTLFQILISLNRKPVIYTPAYRRNTSLWHAEPHLRKCSDQFAGRDELFSPSSFFLFERLTLNIDVTSSLLFRRTECCRLRNFTRGATIEASWDG